MPYAHTLTHTHVAGRLQTVRDFRPKQNGFPTFYDNLFDYFLVKVQTLSSFSLLVSLFRLFSHSISLVALVLHSPEQNGSGNVAQHMRHSSFGKGSIFAWVCVCWLCENKFYCIFFGAKWHQQQNARAAICIVRGRGSMNVSVSERGKGCLHMRVCATPATKTFCLLPFNQAW